MPIDYSGPGAGKHAYWRNTTKHGTINVGEEDFAPGAPFSGMSERRFDLFKGGHGFAPFSFGDRGGRIGPNTVWHDAVYVLHKCTEKPGLGGNWWIAFANTPDGEDEWKELQQQNVYLQEHAFDTTWEDPFTDRGGNKRKIRRFGFKGAYAIMSLLEDVSENFHRVANGVMDVPALARDAAEAPKLRAENEAKALEIEELRAKIREHEAKALAVATAAEAAAVSGADVLSTPPRGARRGG